MKKLQINFIIVLGIFLCVFASHSSSAKVSPYQGIKLPTKTMPYVAETAHKIFQRFLAGELPIFENIIIDQNSPQFASVFQDTHPNSGVNLIVFARNAIEEYDNTKSHKQEKWQERLAFISMPENFFYTLWDNTNSYVEDRFEHGGSLSSEFKLTAMADILPSNIFQDLAKTLLNDKFSAYNWVVQLEKKDKTPLLQEVGISAFFFINEHLFIVRYSTADAKTYHKNKDKIWKFLANFSCNSFLPKEACNLQKQDLFTSVRMAPANN